MVVEDSVDVCAFAQAVLEKHGYAVISCTNGAEAKRVLAAHRGRIDALLVDVVLPGANGKEVADRARDAHPGLTVIYTSGYSRDVIAQYGVQGNDVVFLPKPYSVNGLALAVRNALDHQ